MPVNCPQHLGSVMEVSWTYPGQSPRFVAPTCAGTVSGDAAASTECAKLSTPVSLQRVVASASDPDITRPNTKNEYLTPAQMQVRFEIHQQRMSLLRLKLRNAGPGPVAVMSTATDMKRTMAALACNREGGPKNLVSI